MPNLWGASTVGREGEGHSYTARMVSRSGPKLATSRSDGVLGVVEERRMSRAG